MSNKLFVDELIAAPFSPMHEDGAIDLKRIPAYVDHLVSKGIKSVFICGTTGESTSLTIHERMLIAYTWVEYGKDKLKIMVHIGGCSLLDAKKLAAHAESIGADAISSMAPVFIKAGSSQVLVEYFEEVLKEAQRIPFYYYHMPSMTHVTIPVFDFLQAADGKLATLKGIKYTHNDLMDMMNCISFQGGKYEVLNGFDEILLAGLAMGATGAVGSTYNYIPEVYQTIMKAFKEGDFDTARKAQCQSIEVVKFLNKFGGIQTGKALLAHVGVDCGPTRLPAKFLSEAQRQELYEGFDRIFKH